MKNRAIALLLVAIVLLLGVLPANAAPNTGRGILLNGTGYSGLRAIMSTGQGTGSPPAFAFSLKSPDVYQLFVQQLHPANGCLQWEVVHERPVGLASKNYVQVYNWCNSTIPYKTQLTDSTFRSKYVQSVSYNDTGTAFTDEIVDVRTYKTTGTTWIAQIYNTTTAGYDTVVTTSGTSLQTSGYADIGDGGYTQDSPGAYCPTLYPWGILQIRGIQKYNGSSWSLIGSGDITNQIADSWPCITNSSYMTTAPQPYQFKLLPFGVGY